MIEYLLSLSLLIVVVLLIRGIFRKTVSPRAIYALWLVVVIRMLLPITLFEVDVTLPEFLQRQQIVQEEQSEQLPEDSEVSADVQEQIPVSTPMQTAPTIPSQSPSQTMPEYPTVITPITPTTPVTPTVPADTTPVTPDSQETTPEEVITPDETVSEVPEEPVSVNWKRTADLVWFSGAVIASVWVLFTSITYFRRLKKDRVFHKTVRGTKVYVSEYAGVPCIAGLIPSIYIKPEAANSKSEILIIIHEHVHLRHGDHIWSIIRALALIVFWWNPLVWLAATVSKQDAELACDDAISSRMNDDGRLKYANILIDTIPQKHRYAVGLGSAPMKERILMLTKKQKNRWLSLILAIVLAVSAVGCSFVSLNEKTNNTVVAKFVGIVDALPDKDPFIAAIGKGGALDYFTFEKGLTFYCRDYSNNCEMQYVLELPDGYTDGNICFAYVGVVSQIGDGVGEIHLLVEAQYGGELKYLDCYFIPEDNFEPGGAIVLSSIKELTADEANVLRGIESELPSYLEIPAITLTQIETLPYSEETAVFTTSPVGGSPTIMFFDDSMTFYFRNYLPESMEYEYFTGTLMLPDGFTDGRVVHVTQGAGSGEIFVSIEAIYNGKKEYLTYGFFGMEAPSGLDVLDDVQTERLMEALGQANTSVVNVIENSGGLNINTVYLPVGENYTDAFRYDDRHILYVTWKDSQKNENGLYSKVGVHFYLIDILNGKIAAEAAYNGTFTSYYDDYTDDGLVLYDILFPDDTSGEIQVVDPVKITYINGALRVEKAQKDSQYPRITRRITSPSGKYEVYNISESDGNILHKTSIEVRYANGSVRRLFRNRTLEEVTSLSAVFTYTPMQFVDDTHFVYSLGGYESTKGFGIYDLATDKKIEFDHGAYDFCLAKDGVIIFRENVRNNEGLPEPYRLWSMTLDGEKTLLASLDEADSVMTMPGGMSYRTGEAWISFINNSKRVLPDYVTSSCVYQTETLYSLDMSKKLAAIEYPSNGGVRAVRNMHFFENSVTIVIPVEPTSLEQQYGQDPFIGYVADAETPWIDLYTEKNGTYVGRIPYEIFNGWPATDRDREWWTPGWEPEYMKYYYAEFGDFCWAAVHLGDTVLGNGRKNIATSADGGKTWNCGSYMDDYGGNHVISIGFLSRNIAYMTFHPDNEPLESSKPAISRTEDGGKTWQRLDIQVPDSLKDYKMYAYAPERLGDSTYRIPVVMYDESGVRRDTELRTYDMGFTWRWQIELTQDQDISFETKTVAVNDGSMVSVTVPTHWVWNDSSHMFNEKDKLNTASTVSIKRAVIMKRSIDMAQLKEELSYGDSGFNYDSPITGTTDKGYSYEGFYGDISEAGRYIFLVNTGSDTYTFEVWTWHGYDGDSFFDDMVMPIINSVTVDASSLMAHYPTDEEILAEYEKATKLDDIFALAISELIGNVNTAVDKPIQIGEHHYFESKKYSSFDELKNELLTVFSREITDEMLDSELIKNVDGKLYAVLADGGDSAPISYRNEIAIIPISDTKLTLRVTVKVTDYYLRTYGHYASGQIIDTVNVDFTYEKIGDNWVFTEFPYIRGVYDSKLREKYTEYEFDFGKLVLLAKYDGKFIFKTDEEKYSLTAAYDPHGDGQYSDDQVFKIWRIPLGEEIPQKDGLTVTNAIGYDDKYVYMMTSGVSTSGSVTYESGFDDAVSECVTAIVTYTPHVNGWQYFGVLEHLIPIEQNAIHQSILENKATVYNPDSKSDVLLSDYLKSSDLDISKYIVLDLDENGANETILWLEKGENECLGFLILNNKNEKTYAHLLYYRQFADLKVDGTFNFSSGVSNHGIGRLYFLGDTCTIDKIAYCESADNRNISYYVEGQSVSKEIFDAYEVVQSQKANAVWHDYTFGS